MSTFNRLPLGTILQHQNFLQQPEAHTQICTNVSTLFLRTLVNCSQSKAQSLYLLSLAAGKARLVLLFDCTTIAQASNQNVTERKKVQRVIHLHFGSFFFAHL